jgi:Lon protease-like protein
VSAYGYRKAADLPQTIPLFPLPGAILFPRAAMPLNIFEPRYLNMVDDALAGDRLIGMIQPAAREAGERPALLHVGAVGKITTFSETEDGRYLITLTGLCRFRLIRELPMSAPYREAIVDFEDFADDLIERPAQIDRSRLRSALVAYIAANRFSADWALIEEAPSETLVNAVAALCPFDLMSKQALLESPTLTERANALIALLEWPNAEGSMQ